MPKLFNVAATQGVLLQAGTPLAITSGSLVCIRVTGIQETNIRRLAYVYIYRNLVSSETGEFFALDAYEVRQPRSAFQVPRPYTANTIIRVVPLYDYTRFELWYNI